jgi:hypothetical protein
MKNNNCPDCGSPLNEELLGYSCKNSYCNYSSESNTYNDELQDAKNFVKKELGQNVEIKVCVFVVYDGFNDEAENKIIKKYPKLLWDFISRN